MTRFHTKNLQNLNPVKMKRDHIDILVFALLLVTISIGLYAICQILCSVFSAEKVLWSGLLLLIVGLIYWLYHILTAKANFASYSVGFETKKVGTYDLLNGLYDKDLIRMDEFAVLSELVYNRNSGLETPVGWVKLEIPRIGTDSTNNGGIVLKGLYYEIWHQKKGEDEITVAVVFRGTHHFSDWIANFRLIRRILGIKVWDHYDELNRIRQDILKPIYEEYPPSKKRLKIVSIGHSLGGGLAQFMAYSNPEVNSVYAFNPSPITGYFDLRSERRENKKDVVIYRIFESGEALSFIRKFMLIPTLGAALFCVKDPRIVRIKFNFKSGDYPWSLHGMYTLAENLIKHKKERTIASSSNNK